MTTLNELLNDADPLRHEPPITADRRMASRAAITAAAVASVNEAHGRARPFRLARFAVISFVVLGIVILGSRLLPTKGGFETHAFVRFELRLAETDPAPGLQEAMVTGSGKVIYLHDEVILENSDVASAELSRDENARYAVMVRFTSSGTGKVRAATQAHMGKPLAILIDGVVVMAPTLRSALGDSAMITWFTQEQAERIVNGLK